MGIFDELDKQKSSTKKSSGGIFAELDKRKNAIAEKEVLRSQGKAVSTRSDRATPTFGGEILRGIAKPAVTLMARPAQLTAALMGRSEDQQTLKSGYLGDIKTSKSGKDVVKDVGRGLELVSNAVGVGALRNVGRNAVKQGAIQVAKRAGIEGLAAGFIQGVGSGISEGKTGKDLLWNAAKSTGFGGLGGFLVGGAGAKLMGTKTPEKLAQQAEEAANMRQFSSKARPSVPKAGAPTVPSQVDVRLAENVPTNVGTKGSIPKVFAETPILPPDKTITPKGTVVPKVTVGAHKSMINDPITSEARKYKSADEFVKAQGEMTYNEWINNNPEAKKLAKELSDKAKTLTGKYKADFLKNEKLKFDNRFIKQWSSVSKEIPEKLSFLSESINKRNLTKEQFIDEFEKLKTGQSLTYRETAQNVLKELANKKMSLSDFYDVTKTKSQLTDIYNKAVGGNTSKVERAKTALRSAYRESPEQLTGGNLDEIAAKSATLIELDKDRALRIALGKEMPRAEDGVTSDAVYRILSADADGELAVKLANSTVPSTSGIKLVTNRLGDRGGIVDTIRDANTTLKKTMDPKAAKKAIAELAEEIRVNKPTLEELNVLIKEITC